MSMTREEAIATLEESKRQNKIMIDNPTTFWASYQMADGVKSAKRRIEALDVALSALRPVSREPLEKFKEYFDDLYGKELKVYGWHMNGEAKSFDDFYEDACEYAGL